MFYNGIGLNAVAILIDMAKWTWEALMRTETTLKTESLPLRFRPCYKSGWRKIKAPSGTHRSYLRQLAYNYEIGEQKEVREIIWKKGNK